MEKGGRMSETDHFPTTEQTWLLDRLAEGHGGSSARRDHIMTRYREPLLAYARGSSLRTVAEPDELVHGFFVAFFERPDGLERWAESGTRLRRWMMNGMGFYARGVVRDRMRDRLRPFTDLTGSAAPSSDSTSTGAEEALLPADERTSEAAFEHAWAIAVLDAAHTQAHAELSNEDRLDEYDVFRRRVIEGEGYDTIGPSVGMSAQQCAGATRLVSQRMAAALREVLRAEGVRESEMDRTVQEVQRAVGGG